jgi:hypothetical protein
MSAPTPLTDECRKLLEHRLDVLAALLDDLAYELSPGPERAKKKIEYQSEMYEILGALKPYREGSGSAITAGSEG